MRNAKATLLLVVSLGLIEITLPSRAQSPPAAGLATTMPAPGKAMTSDQAALDASPLPDGISFQAFGEMMITLAQTPAPMRGAQEIAVYRQAAPAVVLLQTKKGSGSGVVLQNGQIVTNRHVVEGMGHVEIV